MVQNPLIRLECGVNNYEWGKKGKESAVAKLAAATPPKDFSVQEEKPYSELWMGTHPTLPSRDLATQRTLIDLLEDNQALVSQDIAKRFGPKLPFLFKVLSIAKPLSIQAHPDKKLAEVLHAKDPKHYPDDNHKPEMALAITPFEGLCGFRPLAEISHFLSTIPPLRKAVGEEAAKNFETTVKAREASRSDEDSKTNKKALKDTFASLLQAGKEQTGPAIEELVKLAEEQGERFAGGGGPSNTGAELAELVTRISGQFPGDIGLVVMFFLNFVRMSPGEAMYLRADDIHAYISGDIIECMASSDNVVRAGFSPKFQDTETLLSMLTYDYAPIEEQKMQPVDYPYVTLSSAAYSSNSTATLYDPPIDEFSVVKLDLKKSGAKATYEAIAGPSVIICTEGRGKISVGPKVEEIKTGYVFFVGATAETVLESTGDEALVTYKAFCDLGGKEDGKEGKL